jgi:hypothetical protein
LLRASENVQSCCTSGLIDGEIPDKNGWLSAGVALSLLTASNQARTGFSLMPLSKNLV